MTFQQQPGGQHRLQDREVVPGGTSTKKCSKCGVTKPCSEFSKDKYMSTGLHSSCKTCKNKNQQRLHHKRRAHGLNGQSIPEVVQEKTCGRCKLTKFSTDFSKALSRKDGLQAHCKGCYNDWSKERRQGKRQLPHQAVTFKLEGVSESCLEARPRSHKRARPAQLAVQQGFPDVHGRVAQFLDNPPTQNGAALQMSLDVDPTLAGHPTLGQFYFP